MLYSGSQLVELFFAVSKSAFDSTHHRLRCLSVRRRWGTYDLEMFCVQCEVNLEHLLCDAACM